MRDKIISFKAKPESVDLETRIIRNAILAQTGEAKGHGFSIEQQFITDLVSQANDGVLCNFGHNWDNMGFQLGRATAVKTMGNAAVGDLTIYSNADNSPKMKGMGTWVLNQAKEDPESIMLSICFAPSYFYQYDENGKSVTCRQDWWGDPIVEFKDRPMFVALRKLRSVDVVHSGALTDKMFGEGERGFFQKFMDYLKKDKKDMANTPQNAPNPDDVIDKPTPVIAAAQITIGDKTYKAQEVTDLLTQLAALKEKDTDNQSFMAAFKAEIKQLKSENAELKATPAADLTDGATGNPAPAKTMSRSEKFNASINASIGK